MLRRSTKNYIRNKAWIFLKANWTLRSGITLKVTNDSDWFVFNEIFTNKEYDPAYWLFLTSASKRPLILDLGANVGYFTLKIANELILNGFSQFDIISLEASPLNYHILQERVSQPLLENKVKCFLGLAGYKSGVNTVVHSKQHYGHSSVSNKSKNVKVVEVKYMNIVTLIQDTKRRVDLLKCDIEGSEKIFIDNYTDLLNRTDHAVFEFHARECNIENCRKLLLQAGLSSKGIIKEDPSYKTIVEIFARR